MEVKEMTGDPLAVIASHLADLVECFGEVIELLYELLEVEVEYEEQVSGCEAVAAEPVAADASALDSCG